MHVQCVACTRGCGGGVCTRALWSRTPCITAGPSLCHVHVCCCVWCRSGGPHENRRGKRGSNDASPYQPARGRSRRHRRLVFSFSAGGILVPLQTSLNYTTKRHTITRYLSTNFPTQESSRRARNPFGPELSDVRAPTASEHERGAARSTCYQNMSAALIVGHDSETALATHEAATQVAFKRTPDAAIAWTNPLCECICRCVSYEIRDPDSSKYCVCQQCQGTGRCQGCGGKGNLGQNDVAILKLETSKKPDGSYTKDHVTMIRKVTVQCSRCGGTKPSYRGGAGGGSSSPYTPPDFYAVSPATGRAGDGVCRNCNGLGQLLNVSGSPASRRLRSLG